MVTQITPGGLRSRTMPDMHRAGARYLRGDVQGELWGRVGSVGGAEWLLQDRLGSLRNVLDDTGAEVNRVEYDGFGNMVYETVAGLTGDFTFTALWYTRDIDMHHAVHREYAAAWGVWAQDDPILFDGGDWNVRRYVGNGPTNRTDLSGLAATHYFWECIETGRKLTLIPELNGIRRVEVVHEHAVRRSANRPSFARKWNGTVVILPTFESTKGEVFAKGHGWIDTAGTYFSGLGGSCHIWIIDDVSDLETVMSFYSRGSIKQLVFGGHSDGICGIWLARGGAKSVSLQSLNNSPKTAKAIKSRLAVGATVWMHTYNTADKNDPTEMKALASLLMANIKAAGDCAYEWGRVEKVVNISELDSRDRQRATRRWDPASKKVYYTLPIEWTIQVAPK